MAEQRFSVPSDPTKTAAAQRTSPRAERAIKLSAMREQLPKNQLRASRIARRRRRILDVRAADLQEEMAEQRFSVPSDPTKTAAAQRTSPRAERAIKLSAMREQLPKNQLRASQIARRRRRILDVRAADLQEEMAEQRFSVPSDPTKTAAAQRTSPRAER